MAYHIQRHDDGSSTVLSDEELSEQRAEQRRENFYLVPALLFAVVFFVISYHYLGASTPIGKICALVAPTTGFFLGVKVAKYFWIAVGLCLLAGVLYLLGRWIFHKEPEKPTKAKSQHEITIDKKKVKGIGR